MSRKALEMLPTQIKRARSGGNSACDKLRSALGPLAEIRAPHEADEPILAPAVRAALFSWLAEIRAADELQSIGLKPRSTALLYGPPGTGKTTLAHHLSARLGIPMVIVGPENLHGSFLGESEKNVVKLFAAIQACDIPCLLFMDEVESLAGHRDKNRAGGADNARSSALGVLLRKIEEYAGFWIGATNRKDDIDPAFWRRVHMQISVDLPEHEERFAILRRYGLPYDFADENLDLLADATEGASPALLRGLMEGIKRALVIWPKIGRSVDDPAAVIAAIVATLAPPPEMSEPALWRNPGIASALTWPPVFDAGKDGR